MLAWPLQGHCKAAARSVVYELNRGRFMLNGLNHLFISHGSDGSMYHMGNLVITKIFFGIVKENKWSFCELIILKVFHDLFCKITKKITLTWINFKNSSFHLKLFLCIIDYMCSILEILGMCLYFQIKCTLT